MACWSFFVRFFVFFARFATPRNRGVFSVTWVAKTRGNRWEDLYTWYCELPLGANLQQTKLACCCSSHLHSQTLTQTYTADCDVCRGFSLLELVVSYVWSVGDGVGVYDTIAWFNLVVCLISICNGNTG